MAVNRFFVCLFVLMLCCKLCIGMVVASKTSFKVHSAVRH